MTTPLEVTQGDQVTVTWNFKRDISAYTSATIQLVREGTSVLKTVAGPFSGTSFQSTLDPADLAVVGDYWMNAKMSPGPHTYPGNGPIILRVIPKLV